MIEMILAGLLVLAVFYGCLWLNTTAPFVLAFIIGLVAGVALSVAVGLWWIRREKT